MISSSHGVIHQVTLTLASSKETPENKEILEKWLDMIWNDIGRHLKDIELKFMSLTVDILVDVISTRKQIPCAFMLEKSMPILLQIFTQSESKKVNVLHFIAKLLKDSVCEESSKPSHSVRFFLIFLRFPCL